MSPYDALLVVAALSTVAMIYMVYWGLWCAAWEMLWPSGPAWLVRPHVGYFLLVNITGVIITLMILSKVSDT